MSIQTTGDRLFKTFYGTARKYSAQRTRIKQFRKLARKDQLTPEQIKEIESFYSAYKKPNLVFHAFFTQKTGVFSPYYIPQDIYVGYIDPYMNNIEEARYLENKCYFDFLFRSIPQPETVVKRMNGIWFDGTGAVVTWEGIADLLVKEKEGVFVKIAQESGGGHGVFYVEHGIAMAERLKEITGKVPQDIVVQRPIRQHPKMALINPTSVNTLRMYSLLSTDGTAKIYSVVTRMGVGDTKVDNYSSGGIACGVTENGVMRRYAYAKAGDRVEVHPTTNIKFEGFEIPNYDLAVELVKKTHPMLPHFRSVSWDIAIAEDKALLIEANLCRGGIDLLQLANGPLFGEDTRLILDEVFHKEKK